MQCLNKVTTSLKFKAEIASFYAEQKVFQMTQTQPYKVPKNWSTLTKLVCWSKTHTFPLIKHDKVTFYWGQVKLQEGHLVLYISNKFSVCKLILNSIISLTILTLNTQESKLTTMKPGKGKELFYSHQPTSLTTLIEKHFIIKSECRTTNGGSFEEGNATQTKITNNKFKSTRWTMELVLGT